MRPSRSILRLLGAAGWAETVPHHPALSGTTATSETCDAKHRAESTELAPGVSPDVAW